MSPDMIEEQARVVGVAEGSAWVETRRRSACGSCSVAGGCGTSALDKLLGDRPHRFRVDDHLGVRTGEQVVVGIDQAALTRASLLAYLLPVLTLILAALAAEAAGMGDGLGAVAGILGLAFGLWLSGRLSTDPGRRERWRPVLLRRAPAAVIVQGLNPPKVTTPPRPMDPNTR
jgi:sigma-E factor negative regulatory protein RseC